MNLVDAISAIVAALPVLRDVLAVGLLGVVILRESPAMRARLDHLAACGKVAADALGVVLPPPPPPLPSFLSILGGFLMKRSVPIFLLVAACFAAVFSLGGCAAGEAAALAGKRSICAVGEGVALGTRIWCGEPDPAPAMAVAPWPKAAEYQQTVRVVIETPNAIPTAAAPQTARDPQSTGFVFSAEPATCYGNVCGVPSGPGPPTSK